MPIPKLPKQKKHQSLTWPQWAKGSSRLKTNGTQNRTEWNLSKKSKRQNTKTEGKQKKERKKKVKRLKGEGTKGVGDGGGGGGKMGKDWAQLALKRTVSGGGVGTHSR